MLPKTSKDWQGIEQEIQWPKNSELIANVGSVYLVRCKKNVYAVVYGLEVIDSLDRTSAAIEFGNCIFHQADCEGLLD